MIGGKLTAVHEYGGAPSEAEIRKYNAHRASGYLRRLPFPGLWLGHFRSRDEKGYGCFWEKGGNHGDHTKFSLRLLAFCSLTEVDYLITSKLADRGIKEIMRRRAGDLSRCLRTELWR